MTKNLTRMGLLATLSQAALLTASAAWAQTTPTGVPSASPERPAPDAAVTTRVRPGLEEVTVTARRRKESLMSVPVTVIGLTAKTIQQYNLDNIEKVGESIPNVQFVKAAAGGSGAIFNIRGIGTSPIDSGLSQSVSLVFDDTPLGQGNLIDLGDFDIASVQVLKGPQALFFGKNSPAGVIDFESNNPGHTYSGYAKASYEFNGKEPAIEGAVDLPVSDTFTMRVALKYRDLIDGYTTNDAKAMLDPIYGIPIPAPSHRGEPQESELDGRLTAVWTPLANLKVTYKFTGSRYFTSGDQSLETQTSCAPGQTVPTTVGIPDPGDSCKLSTTHALGVFPTAATTGIPNANGDGSPFLHQYTMINTLKAEYTLPLVNLTSVTSYTYYNHDAFGNSTGGSLWYFSGENDENYHGFSQEVRGTTTLPGPLNFSFGAYYERSRTQTNGYRFVGPFGADPATGIYYAEHSSPQENRQTISTFVQGRYTITPKLELDAGVRFSYDNTDLRNLGNAYVNPNTIGIFPLLPPGETLSSVLDDRNFSPEVSLNYKLTPTTLLYATYKTGYKSGGFGLPNLVTATTTVAQTELQPETTRGGEVGFKGDFMSHTLRVQSSLYYYEFSNLQSVAFDPYTTSYVFANAASAVTRGFDTQIDWRATDRLTLNSSVGYDDAHYLSFTNAFCSAAQTVYPNGRPCNSAGQQNLSGAALPQASTFNGALGFNYDQPIGTDYTLSFYSNGSYRSKYNVSDIDIPQAEVNGFFRLDAGLRFSPNAGPWEIALYSRNLTNHIVPVYTTDKPGAQAGETYAAGITRPREVALQLTDHF